MAAAAPEQHDLDGHIAYVLGRDPAPFEALIGQLMSADNEARRHAEKLFNICRTQHGDTLVLKLMHTLQYSQVVEIRSMAALLVRKQMVIWPQLSSQSQSSIKEQLIVCVKQEQVKTVVKKLCDTVAELAASIIEDGQWNELFPFLFQCVSSDTSQWKESALMIFGQLAQYMGPSLHSDLSTLHSVFKQNLGSSMPGVRLAAFRATSSFVQTLETLQDRERFQDLLPGMMQTLNQALDVHEEATAQEALEMFIEIAGTEPQFLRKQLVEIVSNMLKIADADGLEDATRHLAVEFLITLAEARERAPGMMRRLPHFIGNLFAILMKMLLDVEDSTAWHSAEIEYENAGESNNYEFGQECLDRFANSLGGSSILPFAFELLPLYLSDQDWRKRHAALICLSQIAEGCSKVMIRNLEPIVNMVLNSFQDPHPRVRWASINAVGQLSADLGPDLQEQFHQHLLPTLVMGMDDLLNPRVQAHAATTILNFSEGCTPQILTPYLDIVVNKLLVLLQSGKRMVQEGALTALASVADSTQMNFQVYYDAVMPYLKAILMNATDKSDRMLRAKSMECISLIGMAVGKEMFGQDAKQVMDVLMSLQGTQLEHDDPIVNYMLQAWGRICKCLGQEFQPYMSIVMPPLLRSAQLKPDVTITDAANVENDNLDSDDESVERITIGDKKIGIRTSILEEKATACNMLCCYAVELKEGFYPWVDQVASTLVPLFNFYFHEDVRKAAVSAMPELLHSAKLALEKGVAVGRNESYLKQLTNYVMSALVQALHKEPETEVLSSMLQSINECIKIVGIFLEGNHVKSMVDEFKQAITAINTRKRERAERAKTEDFGPEEGEILLEENALEEEIFDQIGECVSTLVKTFKAPFLPFFEELIPFITPMLGDDHTAEERRISICIFDDVAEQCQGSACKYYDTFLPFLLEASVDADPDVRQPAVYGIGVCAQFGGVTFRPFVGEALTKIKQTISQPEAFTANNIMATDNAVSALGKICEFQRDNIDSEQVVPAWLSCLPIRNDLAVAKLVHAQLCSMVERSDPQVLGADNRNLPKVISVFAEVLIAGNDLASEATVERIVNLVKRMQQTSSPQALLAIWSSLQPEEQTVLQSILSPQPPSR
ncbi:hypothetical protein KP509_21G047300 [Ceratopteris richardii]|uniref:TOG domain-containing protein n=1 Tax=Ceratopteris richardii TaxID=49495 RepID=A0A8T2SBP4_CERRI|nr:hypothetical protein KP509_21G047300 [Ceratopteris richardii]KAH7315387.1 hypothetical protein KP509_21G047300 [Ceratopteris richardii]